MVRLQSSEPGEGAHPQVVDLLLNSAAGSKRTRAQTSSLDYKNSGGSNNRAVIDQNIVTTAKVLSSEQQRQQKASNNQNSGQSQQQQQRPKTATRARGSSGIPPRKAKIELSDLQGMTEDQIMQALYADPELAELAAEQIAQAQKHSNQKQRKAGGVGSNSSKASGNRGDKMIKEKGFPYEQWAVLLILVGFGVYHLFKSMSKRGSKSAHASKPKREISLSKGKNKNIGSKNRNSRGNNSATSKKRDTISTPVEPSAVAEVEKVVAEIEGISSTKSVKSLEFSDGKTKKTTKPKKKKKVGSSLKTTDNPANTSQSASNESLHTTDEDEAETFKQTNSPTPLYSKSVIGVEDYGEPPADDEVWETVSKPKNASGKIKNVESLIVVETSETKSNLATVQIRETAVEFVKPSVKPLKETTSAQTLTKPPNSLELEPAQPLQVDVSISIVKNGESQVPVVENQLACKEVSDLNSSSASASKNGTSNGSTKKKKKKKPAATKDKAENTDSDAVFALQLQQEEEKLVELEQEQLAAVLLASSAGEQQETVAWAEVTTKKKKIGNAAKSNEDVE